MMTMVHCRKALTFVIDPANMPGMKPLLLMDVDGVLCPWGAGPRTIDGHKPWHLDSVAANVRTDDIPGYTYNDDWYVYINPENSERLKKLRERFDMVWCTGWEERANEVISPLHGLPQLPYVPIRSYSSHIHWKYESIENYVGRDQPYAFVDDDIGADGIAFARWRNGKVPTLWLKVTCSEGFGPHHVRQLDEFADRCALYFENALAQ